MKTMQIANIFCTKKAIVYGKAEVRTLFVEDSADGSTDLCIDQIFKFEEGKRYKITVEEL